MQLNALTTLSLPLVIVWLTSHRPLRQPPPAAVYSALTVTTLFTITRNL